MIRRPDRRTNIRHADRVSREGRIVARCGAAGTFVVVARIDQPVTCKRCIKAKPLRVEAARQRYGHA